MTEDELRDRLFRTINLLHLEGWETETVVDAIIAHIKEAGWKPPDEEVDKMKCCPEYEPLSDIAICNLAYRGGKPHYDEGYCGHGKCRNGTGIDWEKGE